jgi:hypothetical protein
MHIMMGNFHKLNESHDVADNIAEKNLSLIRTGFSCIGVEWKIAKCLCMFNGTINLEFKQYLV